MTMYTAKMRYIPHFFLSKKTAGYIAIILLITQLFAHTANAQDTVGKATLVIGQAYIERGDTKRRINTGDIISIKDRITTLPSGHVHIRFFDQALVSVRPDSQLEIEAYDFNPDEPSQSTVKFKLHKGAARSISGEAAKSAKERFRLNTPIAAIGVRGTDFVVRADQDSLQATVNEGAIIVTPFSDHCSATSFTSCNENAIELAYNATQPLKLNLKQQASILTPHYALLSESDDATQNKNTRVSISALHNDSASEESADDQNSPNYDKSISNREKLFNSALANISLSHGQNEAPAQPPTERQLVWGHWSNTATTLILPYQEAIQDRHITAGNAQYGLFRLNSDVQKVKISLGEIAFKLTTAQATYTSATTTSAMDINSGHLNINFATSKFDTRLKLNHPSTGNVVFNANGRLRDDGIITARTDSQRLGGAISFDATEAGYFFNKQLPTGNIEGLTLWGQK